MWSPFFTSLSFGTLFSFFLLFLFLVAFLSQVHLIYVLPWRPSIRYVDFYDAAVWQDGQSFVGYVSTADIVQHIVDFCRPAGEQRTHASFADFLQRLSVEEVSTVINAAQKQPFVSVKPTASLHTVLQLLAERHVDRVCVQQQPSSLMGVITQQHVIRLLAENVDTLAPALQGTVASAKLGLKPVLSVRHDAPMLEALQLMATRGISAVGVLGQDQELLTTLSTSDIRGVFNQDGDFFHLTTLALVQRSRMMDRKDAPGILVAHPDTALMDVVRKLAATGSRSHRTLSVSPPYTTIGLFYMSAAFFSSLVSVVFVGQ